MGSSTTKKDIQTIIETILSKTYSTIEPDVDYQSGFSEEGGRKAQYIVDDLRYRESQGMVRVSDLGYLSIGGADGSEIEFILSQTEISRGVIIEISDSGAERARERSKALSVLGKELLVVQGDAMGVLDQALEKLEQWLAEGAISGLVCSAQAVLHELPRRSPTYNLSVFIGKLFRKSEWSTCAFYSREPSRPQGWTESVMIRIPGVRGESLSKFATYTRDRLSMAGIPSALAGEWVGMPSMLAVETLHKLIRGNSLRRISYELGEQLTQFDPIAVKKQLEVLVSGMRVSVDSITTGGFKRALEDYAVEYVDDKSEPLPVPRTHSEIVGFASLRPPAVRDALPVRQPAKDAEQPLPLSSDEVSDIFAGEIRPVEVDAWLDQFESGERIYIANLLRGFKYFGRSDTMELYRKLYNLVIERLPGVDPSVIRFVPLGGAATSGALAAYQFRMANSLSPSAFLESASLKDGDDLSTMPLVFLDDILASGHHAAQTWKSLVSTGKLSNKSRVLLATLVGTAAGTRFLEERTNFETCSAVLLDKSDDPLSDQSRIFSDAQAREVTRRIVEAYGRRLSPTAPFGYLGTGMMVSFSHGVPNNTLPIFWSKQADWQPLLDRISALEIKVGETYEGKISEVNDFMARVSLGRGKDAILRLNDIEDRPISFMTEFLRKGQAVKVKVKETDAYGEIIVSMKFRTDDVVEEKELPLRLSED